MKLIATMPCRNEDWCIGLTARSALIWCDEVHVLLHSCTDNSFDIIREINHESGALLTYERLDDQQWHEMSHRQEMLMHARRRGATHVALIDADEVLTGNLLPDIRRIVEHHTMQDHILNLPWLAMARETGRYLSGPGLWGDRQQVTCAFRDQQAFHWSSGERGGYDFHQRPPMGGTRKFVCPVKPHDGGIMHLQFLSERRLRAKQALYQMTELLRWPGRKTPNELAAMYGPTVYQSHPEFKGVATSLVPDSWWSSYDAFPRLLESEIVEPWQEAEVKRLIAEHGAARFSGLDLFGVAEVPK